MNVKGLKKRCLEQAGIAVADLALQSYASIAAFSLSLSIFSHLSQQLHNLNLSEFGHGCRSLLAVVVPAAGKN